MPGPTSTRGGAPAFARLAKPSASRLTARTATHAAVRGQARVTCVIAITTPPAPAGCGLGVLALVARGGAVGVGLVVRRVSVALLRADADRLRLLLGGALARLDELQLQGSLVGVAVGIALNQHGRAGDDLALLQHLV